MQTKIPFNEWDNLLGYKTKQSDVKILYHPVLFDAPIDLPDDEKGLLLNHEPKSRYRLTYEVLRDDFTSMGEFTYELYLAMPYFVEIYQMWKQKQDFQLQLLFLTLIGDCLSTDFPCNHFSKKLNENLPKEIIENYLKSVQIIQEEAKEFVSENIEKLKLLNLHEAEYFCLCLFAILGDRKASYVFFMGGFNECYISCPNCTEPDEDFYIDYYFDWYLGKNSISLTKDIQPAPSVIGEWDLKSYDNNYVWMSNLLYLLGNKDGAKKMSLYYGTYTCPNCGKKGDIIIDLLKRRMIRNEESSVE